MRVNPPASTIASLPLLQRKKSAAHQHKRYCPPVAVNVTATQVEFAGALLVALTPVEFAGALLVAMTPQW
jgi:hypothetical protein